MTLEDSSQRGAQAGSSTGRVWGIFGLPGHAEEESGDGGLFSPRLDEMVTAGAGTCLCLASQVFKHTAVTYRRGDRDQIPPAAPKIPRAPAHHPLPPIEPWRAQDPQEWAVSGCTTLHPGGHYTASSMVPSCREQHPQDPKSCNSLCHSHILGQDPVRSAEHLAAEGPHGPSVLQPQKLSVCRKSGSNLSLAQTWHEVTATNELNDQTNVHPSSPCGTNGDRCDGTGHSVLTELQRILHESNLYPGDGGSSIPELVPSTSTAPQPVPGMRSWRAEAELPIWAAAWI